MSDSGLKTSTLQSQTPDGVYFCESCTKRFSEPGDCSHCPEEPLLDLRDEDVRHMLINFDQARMRKRVGLYTGIGAALAVPVALSLVFVIGIWITLAVGVGIVAAVSGLLYAVAPPKRKAPRAKDMPAVVAQF